MRFAWWRGRRLRVLRGPTARLAQVPERHDVDRVPLPDWPGKRELRARKTRALRTVPGRGGTESRKTICLQDGTADCTCGRDAGSLDSGVGSDSGQSKPDAGDSASLDTDAGDDSDGG